MVHVPLPSAGRTREAVREFVPLHMPVNFAARAVRAVPMVHPDAPALQVAARLLTNGYLHREIREKGGAYGGGAFYDAAEGFFGFYSYRCGGGTRGGGERSVVSVGCCTHRSLVGPTCSRGGVGRSNVVSQGPGDAEHHRHL